MIRQSYYQQPTEATRRQIQCYTLDICQLTPQGSSHLSIFNRKSKAGRHENCPKSYGDSLNPTKAVQGLSKHEALLWAIITARTGGSHKPYLVRQLEKPATGDIHIIIRSVAMVISGLAGFGGTSSRLWGPHTQIRPCSSTCIQQGPADRGGGGEGSSVSTVQLRPGNAVEFC